MYKAWQHSSEETGNVTFRLNCVVTRLISRTKKRTILEYYDQTSHPNQLKTEEFDSLILATDADNALTILGKEANWMERIVLGGVKYLRDLTVTHTDTDYMRKVLSVPYQALSAYMLMYQWPNSTTGSLPRPRSTGSDTVARPTFVPSTTPTDICSRVLRSWRCLSFTNLNPGHFLGSRTSIKRPF